MIGFTSSGGLLSNSGGFFQRQTTPVSCSVACRRAGHSPFPETTAANLLTANPAATRGVRSARNKTARTAARHDVKRTRCKHLRQHAEAKGPATLKVWMMACEVMPFLAPGPNTRSPGTDEVFISSPYNPLHGI